MYLMVFQVQNILTLSKKKKKKKKKKKTIELGHQGEPVEGVILRIYRQTERGDDKKRNKIEKEELKYSQRLRLVDDCDEVIILFYFIFFFFFFFFLSLPQFVIYYYFFYYLFTGY